ncbi:hypothetical protein FCV25MIE_22234 [Fagus crenata]
MSKHCLPSTQAPIHYRRPTTHVHAICKPLKALGIHTVSIHPGASLDHQIQGTFDILFDALNGFLFFYFPSTLILGAQRFAAVDFDVVSKSNHRINDYDDSSNGEGDRVAENGKAKESKKVKAKKPKKPKVIVSDAATKIDADDLSAFLADITVSFAF